jgi:4'-phosphopantetheinyl transferase EntD
MHVAPDAVLVMDQIERCQHPLLGAERVLADRVTNSRLRELQAGRSLARFGIQYLGTEPAPVLATPAGLPIWPPGLCGSLSHSHRHVAALVARSSCYDSVGVDIDDGRFLGTAALADVVQPDELTAVSRAGLVCDKVTAEGLAFSAKEAIFKCQYAVTQDLSLDFLDVHLICGNIPGTLEIEVLNPERHDLAKITDRIRLYIANIQGITAVYALLSRRPDPSIV